MNSKQRITWTLIMLLLMTIAWATSMMKDTDARTLARVMVGLLIVLSIRVCWVEFRFASRQQARINKIQRRCARDRAAMSGGVAS